MDKPKGTWTTYGYHVLSELERLDMNHKELTKEVNKINYQVALIVGKSVAFSILFAGLVSIISAVLAKSLSG